LVKRAETVQTTAIQSQPPETILTHVTHSKMLSTRRKRQRASKDFAGMVKRAKKLARKNAQKAGGAAPKSP